MYAIVYALLTVLLLSIEQTGCFFGQTLILPRSQTVNAAMELAGWQEHINDYDVGRNYASFYMAPEYKRSCNNQQLLNFLFGGRNWFAVQGSQVPDRSSKALLADYFGLPSDFASYIYFNPQITSFIWDMNAYIGFDRYCENLYLRIHMPLVHTKWDLNLTECIDMVGTATYPAGYMGPQDIPRYDLASSFSQAISGEFCNRYKQNGPFEWGDMQDPLQYGRIQGRRNTSRLSDIHVILGYNCWNGPTYHAGFNARVSAPAGTQPDARYFFEPIVGNGHHWEGGFGWTSHIIVWQKEDEATYVGFWWDTNVTHMFPDEQLRSFDFVGNPGSRYMLLSQLAAVDGAAQVLVAGAPITEQYIGALYPAINKATLRAKISLNVQVDLVAKFSAQIKGVQMDLGYELWYRSAEKLHSLECFDSYLAFKGDAQLYGFVSTSAGDFTLDEPLALNVTQHEATLLAGQGAGNFVAGAQFANANADTPGLAADSNGNILYQLDASDAAFLAIPQQQISGSITPVLLTAADIDVCSALNPHAISHKVFASIAHSWENDSVCFAPFLSGGVEVEWRCGCFKSNSAISQWGLWAKGGLSF